MGLRAILILWLHALNGISLPVSQLMQTVVFLTEDKDTANTLHYIFLLMPSYGSVRLCSVCSMMGMM